MKYCSECNEQLTEILKFPCNVCFDNVERPHWTPTPPIRKLIAEAERKGFEIGLEAACEWWHVGGGKYRNVADPKVSEDLLLNADELYQRYKEVTK